MDTKSKTSRGHALRIAIGTTLLIILSGGGGAALSNDGGGSWQYYRDVTFISRYLRCITRTGIMALVILLLAGGASAVALTDPTGDWFTGNGNPATGYDYTDIISANIEQVSPTELKATTIVNANIPGFGWHGYRWFLDTDKNSATGGTGYLLNDIGADYWVEVAGNSGIPNPSIAIWKTGYGLIKRITNYSVQANKVEITFSISDVGNPDSFNWIADSTDGVSVNDHVPNSGHGTFTSKPVAEYHFDGDVNDSSGNGYNGTNHGAAFGSGIKGQGLFFDGSDWVDIPDNIAATRITLASWIKLSGFDDYNGAPVITKETGSGYASDFGWRLFIHAGSHQIAFEASNGTASGSALSSTALSTNKWYYVVGTYDGNMLKIYVNGVLKGTANLSGDLNMKNMPTAIGHLQGWGVQWFKGRIDETSIYGHALSESEIQTNYINIAAPASITGLKNVSYAPTYINWTWVDPSDADFARVMVYINGIFKTNVTKGKQYYNAVGLTPKTKYNISTHTVDTEGNINSTWVNSTAWTACGVSKINGYSFNDTNGNKAIDPGETGLYGRAINLKGLDTCTGTLVNRATATDSTGYFEFSNVNPGIYVVSEEFILGWLPTTDAAYTITVPSIPASIKRNFGNKNI